MKRLALPGVALTTALLIAVPAGAAGGPDTIRVSLKANGNEAPGSSVYSAISSNGRFIAYESSGSLTGTDDDMDFDVYLFDRLNGKNELISVDSSGDPRDDVECFAADISPNGRYVSFGCAGALVSADTNGIEDVYRRDLETDKTIRISLTGAGDQLSGVNDDSEISGVANNGLVAWASFGTFVGGDSNTAFDTFVRDPAEGTTVRASVRANDGELPNGVGSVEPDKDSKLAISGNGRYVAFSSPDKATNEPDFGMAFDTDIFVRDLKREKTARASLRANGTEADSNDNAPSFTPSISSDGRYVAFRADTSTELESGDDNGLHDIYVKDMTTGAVERASVKSNGDEGNGSSLPPQYPEISANGRYVVFDTASDFGGNPDVAERSVYRHDLETRETILVSIAQNGGRTDTNQLGDVANTDWVTFSSFAKNTSEPDSGSDFDVFLRGPLD